MTQSTQTRDVVKMIPLGQNHCPSSYLTSQILDLSLSLSSSRSFALPCWNLELKLSCCQVKQKAKEHYPISSVQMDRHLLRLMIKFSHILAGLVDCGFSQGINLVLVGTNLSFCRD